jgi:hypothetical protein
MTGPSGHLTSILRAIGQVLQRGKCREDARGVGAMNLKNILGDTELA